MELWNYVKIKWLSRKKYCQCYHSSFFNSLWPSDMPNGDICSGNGLIPDGTKPLPKCIISRYQATNPWNKTAIAFFEIEWKLPRANEFMPLSKQMITLSALLNFILWFLASVRSAFAPEMAVHQTVTKLSYMFMTNFSMMVTCITQPISGVQSSLGLFH